MIMMRSKVHDVLLLIVLLQLVFFVTTFDMVTGYHDRVHLRISNELDVGIDLQLHCKSRDNDLGEHLLHYNNSYYEFSFRPRYFGSTLFYCSFRWNTDGCSKLYWFDIYDYNRDGNRCSECYWKALLNGPCMLNHNDNQYDLCYSWNY
ncbi:S-protein homolog 3-like [Carya illinoinensis]|nr:S-protein homolog 3-like [Carya illinoinensis]